MVFSGAMHDVRVAFRGLLKTPGVTFVVVLTLAVAIGASTAIFSVVESVLLRPLPYPDERRIVRVAATVHSTAAGSDRGNTFSARGYWHFVNNNRSFQKFGGYLLPRQVPLTGDGAPREVDVGYMTLNALEVLGIFPEIGRLPTPEEDAPGGPSVALLSHALWAEQYGADPRILGRTINLNGVSREVIGVMPAGFDFPVPEVDAWIPFQLNPASADFSQHFIFAIARLAPGVTIEAAAADARSLVARFTEVGYDASWFEGVFDGGAVVRPFRDYIVGEARQPLLIVLGTVGFVLLIACSNVANLLLVRAEGRRQGNAVRMALGSGRGRIARQALIESSLLAVAGGAAGVVMAHAGIAALVAIGPAGIPRLGEVRVDGAALALTGLVSVLAGLLFGAAPALRSSATVTMDALRDGTRSATVGRSRHRVRNALVVTQVALAFVLVIGSGLMVRSFQALRSVDPGFSADGVLTFVAPPLPTKYATPEARAQLYDRLVERIETVPGVTRAGGADFLPLTGGGNFFTARIEEFPPAQGEFPPGFGVRRATPGYFETMRVPMVEGRAFTHNDHTQRLPSVIISKAVKDRYWPDTSALGKRFTIGNASAQVVGVVGDVHEMGLSAEPYPLLYLPMVDSNGGGSATLRIVVRSAVEPLSIVPAIRSAIAEVDSDLPMANVQSMERVVGDSMSRTSFTMSLLVIGALVALFLGTVGIYGVLSYVVSERTQEIAVRSALGASPADVRRLVLSQGVWLAGTGVLIGLAAAVAMGRVIAVQLYGVSPVDPVTIVAASAIFVTVAALASVLPAARASGTLPVDALRGG
jgi:predicted permease